MRTRILLTIAATATILAGCSNEETNEGIDNWNGEIRLNSELAAQTRATTETIKENEKVYVWADKVALPSSTTADYIKGWELTADASGNLSNSSNPKYYPTEDCTLSFFAMHGNFEGTTITDKNTAFPSSGITHTVLADQSDDDKANYTKSDLLYAITTGVARGSKTVALSFYHMLSKVEIALKSGDGGPTLTDATVSIVAKKKVNFKPSKTVTMGTQSDRADLLEDITSDNDAGEIKIPLKITTEDNFTGATYGEAIIVPQEIAKGADFIKIKLADNQGGATFTYKIPNGGDDQALTLESGKAYKYNITVNSSGLTATSSIIPWTESSSSATTGGATMDEPADSNPNGGGAGNP